MQRTYYHTFLCKIEKLYIAAWHLQARWTYSFKYWQQSEFWNSCSHMHGNPMVFSILANSFMLWLRNFILQLWNTGLKLWIFASVSIIIKSESAFFLDMPLSLKVKDLSTNDIKKIKVNLRLIHCPIFCSETMKRGMHYSMCQIDVVVKD